MPIKYRPDIDVLRAFAVLPVVLYHLGFDVFSGGFVGVDVFFVISGYLITSIFQATPDRINILEFYERRARRILPALTVVVLATLIVGYFLLLPGDLKRLSQSAFAVALFGSNIYFWTTLDYFDAAAHSKPLLHTWSLAVEEQYYILFPYVLWLCRKTSGRNVALPLGIIALLSFLSSAMWPNFDQGDAFYLVHYRAWELLIGAMLATIDLKPIASAAGRMLVALVGLALILVPVFVYDHGTPFPGVTALAPCLGTAAIIWARLQPQDPLAAVFYNKQLIYIGKISYSFYLWHWPVIVFLKYYFIHDLTTVQKLIAFAIAFLLAAISLPLVERPFRTLKIGRIPILTGAVALCAGLAGLGLLGHLKSGFPHRFGAPVAELTTPDGYNARRCFLMKEQQASVWNAEACTFGRPVEGAPTGNVVLWGDSHAAHLMPGLIGWAREGDAQLTAAAFAGCPPLTNYAEYDNPNCESFNNAILSYVGEARPDLVILSARWNAMRDVDRLRSLLGGTVDALKARGATVLLVGETPSFGAPVPVISAMLERRGLPTDSFQTSESFKADDMLRQLAAQKHVGFVSPRDILCSGQTCTLQEGGQLLYWDESHLTSFGSSLVAKYMAPSIGALGDRAVKKAD